MFESPIKFGESRIVFGRAAQTTRGPGQLKGKAASRHHRMVREAAELLPELPGPGEQIHCLMLGFFDLCQVIVDVCRRTKPTRLRLTTLCWNKRNVIDLCGLFEERGEDKLPTTLVASDFFFSHNAGLAEWSKAQFDGWPVSLVSARSHTKLALFDLGPTDALVFEGSANLRTNKNREQLVVIRDKALHDWHATHIDELAGRESDGQKEV